MSTISSPKEVIRQQIRCAMQLGGEEITMTETNKFKYLFLLMGKVVSVAVIANTLFVKAREGQLFMGESH